MRRSEFQPRSDRRLAATLVELLVAMGVGVIVLGILLQTFDHTRRLAAREVQRNHQRQAALLSLERIGAVLAEAVPAESIDEPVGAGEVFEPKHFRVVSWAGADEERLMLHDVSEQATSRVGVAGGRVTSDDGTHIALSRSTTALAPILMRHSDLGVDLQADFEYLHGDEWASSLPAGAFPDMVRVTLTSSVPGSDADAFTISTVISTALGGAL